MWAILSRPPCVDNNYMINGYDDFNKINRDSATLLEYNFQLKNTLIDIAIIIPTI